MLNLLIAIMSDSYDKVVAIDHNANNYEKASLIYEIEITNDLSVEGEGKFFVYSYCGDKYED